MKKKNRILTWGERCEVHPDHQMGMVTNQMIVDRMQEEIDELRKFVSKQARQNTILENALKQITEPWYQNDEDFLREALKRIAYMDDGVFSKGMYCSKIAKEALQKAGGEE